MIGVLLANQMGCRPCLCMNPLLCGRLDGVACQHQHVLGWPSRNVKYPLGRSGLVQHECGCLRVGSHDLGHPMVSKRVDHQSGQALLAARMGRFWVEHWAVQMHVGPCKPHKMGQTIQQMPSML